jgi:DNA-binding transcriptional LysR family regulator
MMNVYPIVAAKRSGTASLKESAVPGLPAEDDIGVDLLLYFLAVAEDLSFTKAARRLKIDQSWLSHKIRQFEIHLGFSLFVRSTRNVDLTTNGRVMIAPARKLSEALGAAQEAARLLQASLTARLRIGAIPFSFQDRQRVSLIDRFAKANPETHVAIVNGPSPALIDKLRSGCLDAAFVSAPFDDNGLEMLLLRISGYSVLLPREHPLASLPAIRAEDLAGVRFATPSEQFNPQSYAAYYRPLIEAGAIPVPVPEFQAATAYAFRWRLPVLSSAAIDEAAQAAGFVVRPLRDHPQCRKYLARLAGHRTPSLNRLWKMAEEVGVAGMSAHSMAS